MRLDVWLDIACLFKTRSEAQKAIKGGKVDVNRQSGKPQKELKLGDEIDITRPLGRRQRVIVRGFAEQHIPKAEARKLYEDITPAPSPEEAEMLRLAKLARPHVRAAQAGAPGRDERRQLRRMKEGRGFR
jgi:ribosome-associated heat shock protein Hsp15